MRVFGTRAAATTVAAAAGAAAPSAPSAPSALELRGLCVRYGSVRAVEQVSVTVAEHAVVALLGANGAGKSSLCRAVMGLTRAQSGQVVLGGRDVSRLGTERRVRLGLSIVLEGRGLLGSLTVHENLQLGAYTRPGDLGTRVEEVYERFPKLASLRTRPARLLSGGELQMLAVGRALMSRPKVLVLDEPSMGLAPKVVDSVIGTLHELRATGLSILLAEQKAVVGLEVADTVHMMAVGRVTASGPAAQFRDQNRLGSAYLGVGEPDSLLAHEPAPATHNEGPPR